MLPLTAIYDWTMWYTKNFSCWVCRRKHEITIGFGCLEKHLDAFLPKTGCKRRQLVIDVV